jgi:hypothetical protein
LWVESFTAPLLRSSKPVGASDGGGTAAVMARLRPAAASIALMDVLLSRGADDTLAVTAG